MADMWSELLACLELGGPESASHRPGEDDTGPGRLIFEGSNQQLDYHRVFGGQILAQFIRAASLTCCGKTVKSLHVVFPSAGITGEPIRYEVGRQREGGTFATLTIAARQSGGAIAHALVSLHAGEDGPDHQSVAASPGVLGPEHQVRLGLIPWETRTTTDLDSPAAQPPHLELWMRTPPVGAQFAQALAAYASDLTLIGTALRPVPGVSQAGAGTVFTSAVTSHTLWFHRPFRTGEWLLLRQEAPILAHGRCYGRGDVLTEDGRLVASYAQEALVRLPS